jgi:hypothetical protein
MKGWRELTKLADLAPTYEIEIECRRCHKSYMRWPAELMANDAYAQMFVDQIQAALKCRDKHCSGKVKVAILYDHLITSFIGGMP